MWERYMSAINETPVKLLDSAVLAGVKFTWQVWFFS